MELRSFLFALLMLASPNCWGAIALDNCSQSADAATSYSHTTGSITDGILIVGTMARDAAGATDGVVTGVTYGGVALTKIREDITATDSSKWFYTGLWYLVNPAAGSGTIAVTMTGTVNAQAIAACTFSGALQASPVDVSGVYSSEAATTTAPTLTLTTTVDGTVTIDVMYSGASGGIVSAAGQTERWDIGINGAGDAAGGGTTIGNSVGDVTHTWTTGSDFAIMSMAAIKPAAEAPAVSIKHKLDNIYSNGNFYIK